MFGWGWKNEGMKNFFVCKGKKKKDEKCNLYKFTLMSLLFYFILFLSNKLGLGNWMRSARKRQKLKGEKTRKKLKKKKKNNAKLVWIFDKGILVKHTRKFYSIFLFSFIPNLGRLHFGRSGEKILKIPPIFHPKITPTTSKRIFLVKLRHWS